MLPVAGLGAARSDAAQRPGKKAPRNIIFMVSDGMSPGVLPMAEIFSNVVRGKGTAWAALLREAATVTGLFDQASLNSCVTDSAAASSAWGSGVRICNGAVNMLPDGRPLTPIATIARERGKRVGLVTTASMTHATPAGFAAVHQKRSAEAEIAPQYMENVDVLMGGGIEFFSGELRPDKRDLIGEYRAAGYEFAADRAGLRKADRARKLLGLFSRGQVPYSVDRRRRNDERTPSLAECTRAALALLDNKSGFLLQVEGGRVDHAAHSSDAAAMLGEQIDFDDAVAVAVEFARQRGDTLVVLCSDHGNSNPGMNGIAKGFQGDAENFGRLSKVTCSFEDLGPMLGKALADKQTGGSAERVKAVIEEHYRISVTDKEAAAIAGAAAGEKGLTLNKQFDAFPGVLGQILCNYFGVGWIGKGHTTDYTISTAIGPGAGEFAGLVRNDHVFEILTGFMGSEFRNPRVSEEEARQLLSWRQPAEEIHWV